MDPWDIGLVLLLVVGVVVILTGALLDRHRNRRAAQAMLTPPQRRIPAFSPDAPAPQYLSELQARRPPSSGATPTLTPTERDAVRSNLSGSDTIVIKAGYAAAGFVTDPETSWAVLDDPLVLVCAEPVGSVRELLPVLERVALSRRGLVAVAPQLSPDVLGTLEVNAIQRRLRVLAVVATDPGFLKRAALSTGAEQVSRADLQAGYLDSSQLGTCARWVATKDASYVFPAARSDAPDQIA